MPPAKHAGLTLLDSIIILLLGGMLALVVLWAGSQLNGGALFTNVPDWLSKAASSIWTYATGGASSLVLGALRWRSKAPAPNYLLWIGGTTVVLCLAVFGAALAEQHPSQGLGTTALLRFSLKCDRAEHPNLSFFQKDPLYKQAHTIAAESDGNYKEYVDFPKEAATRFYGRAVRVVSSSLATDAPISPVTELCFKPNPKPPLNNAPFEAHLECLEGKRCSISGDDPGWVTDCSTNEKTAPIGLITTVYADEKVQPGWKVPSLETLRKMGDRERAGYTEFSIHSSQLSGLNADSVQYLIKANGSPLYVDGWAPEDMLKPFENPGDFTFSFGLQNLNFSGADDGCEHIQVYLSFRQQGRVIKQVALSRKYAALREADQEEVRSDDGTTFTWTGKYVKPRNEDTSEVFALSVPNLQNMRNAKNQIDAARLTYDGMEVVAVLRPPLNNPNYGIVIGVRQPSGQVRFTFDTATASSLLNWILHLPAEQQKRLFRKDAFIYHMRPGDSGTGTYKSCSSIAAHQP